MFYLYNEVSFRALNKVHPITHAVANTTKRVVIILSSVLMFRNPMTPTGILGSAMAVAGVFLYSLCQEYFKPKKN
jgi:solute carrier family 35, member E1